MSILNVSQVCLYKVGHKGYGPILNVAKVYVCQQSHEEDHRSILNVKEVYLYKQGHEDHRSILNVKEVYFIQAGP